MWNVDFDFKEFVKERGQKKAGYINLCKKVDGSDIRLPYMLVTGKEDGPTFVIDGAVHGDEYEGPEALAQVYQALDPEELKGNFVCIPALNIEAFNVGNRVSPLDWSYQDMNRAFPGDPNGMITKRLAHFYYENFVKNCDFNLSFHGGGNGLYLEPVATYYGADSPAGPEAAKITQRLAKATNMPVLWCTGEGTRFVGPLGLVAEEDGIPSIIMELGGQGIRNDHRWEMVDLAAQAVTNMMIEMEMLPGKVTYREDAIEITMIYIHADDGGYHRLCVEPKQFVKEGTVCSEIFNIFGEKVNEVKIPFDGYICGYWVYSTIQPGNWAFLFGKPVAEKNHIVL